jgi:hypothetical protein
MITFADAAKIEAKRRMIEALQEDLSLAVHATGFVTKQYDALNPVSVQSEYVPLLREAYCKGIIVKIMAQLTECEHLGVDCTESHKVLADFLQGLKEGFKTAGEWDELTLRPKGGWKANPGTPE